MSAATSWTIPGVRTALLAKKVSARELAAEFYRRIDQRNPELNAYLALSPERAYAQADRVDSAIARGETLPALGGVPIAVKDVISTRGVRTTCGSKILENYVPPFDATAVERLQAADATLREDEVVVCDVAPDVLRQAPDPEGIYFRVPKVIERS